MEDKKLLQKREYNTLNMELLWYIFVENRKQHYKDDRFFIEQKDETRESKEDHVWDSRMGLGG